MFGPGEYVPDPTEGIVDITDLPVPQVGFYSRNHKPTVSLDVISLFASSCGYNRSEIEHRAAH